MITGHFVECVDDILSYHNQTVLMYFSAKSNTDTAWRQVGEAFDNMAIYVHPKPMRYVLSPFPNKAINAPNRTVYKGVAQFVWGTNRVFIVGSYSPFVEWLSDKFSGAYPLYSIPRYCGVSTTKYWSPPYAVSIKTKRKSNNERKK